MEQPKIETKPSDISAPAPREIYKDADYSLSAEELTEIDKACEEAEEDIRAGRTRSMEEVHAGLRKLYGLQG